MKSLLKIILILSLLNQYLNPNPLMAQPSTDFASHKEHYANDQKRKRLTNLYQKAQNEFLKGSLEKSKKWYISITNLSLTEHWPPLEQNMIYRSYLRLAEIEKNKEETWMRKALHYAPWREPSKDIFAPPFRNTYKASKDKIEWELWHPAGRYLEFDQVLINGKSYQLDESLNIELPKAAPLKFTFLSEKWHPVTLTSTLQQLPNKIWALYAKKEKITSQDNTMALKKIKPVHSDLLKEKSFIEMTENHEPIKIKPWYKNKWVWIGLGVLATSAYVISQNQNEKQTQTHESSSSEDGFD